MRNKKGRKTTVLKNASLRNCGIREVCLSMMSQSNQFPKFYFFSFHLMYIPVSFVVMKIYWDYEVKVGAFFFNHPVFYI